MAEFDTIIIGAGPAGATAARTMARAGTHVLLLDKAQLGRDKPCGGGLTPRAHAGLDVDIDDLVMARTSGARLQRGQAIRLRVDLGDDAIWMVRRRDFDRRLTEAAAAAGAEVRMNTAVSEVEDTAGGAITVRTRAETHTTRLLLLATGAEAPLRTALGFAAPTPRMAAALELEGPGECDQLDGGTFIFDYDVPGGYAWIFPKGAWWNAGILTIRPGIGRELRGRLATFMADNGMRFTDPTLNPERATGRRIPFWLRPGTVQRRGIALIGDAAGIADPLFGEGIAQALTSGRLAAGACLDVLAGREQTLDRYPGDLEAALGQHLWRTRQAARMLYAAPTLALRGLKLVSPARRAAVHVAIEPFRAAGTLG